MKWFFVALLTMNIIYFGLEFEYQTRIDAGKQYDALTVPPGVKPLVLLRELPAPPPPRGSAGTDQQDMAMQDGEPDEDELSPLEGESATTDIRINEEFMDELVTDLREIGMPEVVNGNGPESEMCFSYGPFTGSEQMTELVAWFDEHQAPAQQRVEAEQDNQLFWIYLKPGSRDRAIQAIKDLKSKGVTDYRLIETGDLRNAISLGLFSTQASVNRRLNELKDKGYQPVVIPYRDAKAVYWLDVKLIDQQEVLNAMFTGIPARYNSLPVTCGEIAIP